MTPAASASYRSAAELTDGDYDLNEQCERCWRKAAGVCLSCTRPHCSRHLDANAQCSDCSSAPSVPPSAALLDALSAAAFAEAWGE